MSFQFSYHMGHSVKIDVLRMSRVKIIWIMEIYHLCLCFIYLLELFIFWPSVCGICQQRKSILQSFSRCGKYAPGMYPSNPHDKIVCLSQSPLKYIIFACTSCIHMGDIGYIRSMQYLCAWFLLLSKLMWTMSQCLSQRYHKSKCSHKIAVHSQVLPPPLQKKLWERFKRAGRVQRRKIYGPTQMAAIGRWHDYYPPMCINASC